MKKINRKYRLLFLVLCLPLFAGAQLPKYYVHMLAEQQGLNTADIISMAKDNHGFMWILSQSRVQRYDGKQAIQFSFNETLSEVFVDNKDRKWVIGRSSVYLFKNAYSGFTKMTTPATIKSPAVYLFNVGNLLYLLNADGLHLFNEANNVFMPVGNHLFTSTKNVGLVYSKINHTLFVASADSIFQVDLLTQQVQSMAFKSTSFMLAVSEDELLLSDWDSRSFLVRFQSKEQQIIAAKAVDGVTKNEFIRFFRGVHLSGSRYLISSNMGVVEFDRDTHHFHLPEIFHKGRLLGNTTTANPLYRDDAGNLYMSHADGIAFFNPAKEFIHYIRDYSDGKSSLPDIDVRGFDEDNAGNIWMATGNGICRLNMQTGSIKNYLPTNSGSGINSPSTRTLLFKNGYIWTGSGGKGLWLLNTKTEQFKRPVFTKDSIGKRTSEMLNDDFIWKLVQLADGYVFVVGNSGKYIVDAATFVAKMVTLPNTVGVTRSAIQDHAGRIWYGTTQGVYCYDQHFNFLFAVKDSFPDKRVASICEWKQNQILIGTKGLYEVEVKNNAIATFKKLESIPSTRLVYAMQMDSSKQVWMATDEGLYRFDPQNGNNQLFDVEDNIQPQAFNSNGLFLSSNQLLFAGGKTGFNYFYPDKMKKIQPLLKPIVSSLSIGNNDSVFFTKTAPYEVDYFNRTMVFTISAPEYLRPYQLQYRYKLSDDDSAWLTNGTSGAVRLHNPQPGDYSFTASVSYDGITWFDAADRISFTVMKPWWQKNWFRLSLLTVAAFSFFIFYRFKKRQRTNREYQKTIDYFANSGYEHSNTDDILWDITRNCISRMGFEDCVIYLVDEDRQILVQRAAYGAKSPKKFEILNPIEIPMGKGICGYVAKTGIAEIINNTLKDKRYVVDDEVRQSELVVPIIHNEKIIGVIDSENKRKNFFNTKHLQTLQTIASICAAKISLSMAVEKMQKAVKQLEELNGKMLEAKFMNLRLQMNPHFLFNSLSSIQHLVVSKQTNEAYKYLSVFANFLRSILQFADKTFITLDDELKMLAMYINLESLGFDKTFTYDIIVDDELETEDIYIPPLIIQPLIENAIWHGLMHKEGAKYFSVRFFSNEDEDICCIVDDNGIGRQQAAAIDAGNLSHFAYQSKATALIKERLQLLQQKTGREASMITQDKMENGQPSGTRITMVIPSYNHHNNDE